MGEAAEAVRPELPIAIRPAMVGDEGLIFHSWIRSVARTLPDSVDRNWLCSAQHALITRLLEHSVTLVAAEPGGPDQMYGYLVCAPKARVLHFVYVKGMFRKAGVAQRLMEKAFGAVGERSPAVTYTQKTDGLRRHLKRWNLRRDSNLLCRLGR